MQSATVKRFLVTTALGAAVIFTTGHSAMAQDTGTSTTGAVTMVQEGINLRRIQAGGSFGQVTVADWRASQSLQCRQATTTSTACSGGGGSGGHSGSEAGSFDGRGTGTEAGGSDASGSSGHTILCTYYYRKGMIPKQIFVADMEYGFENVSETTLRGYHYWAVPLATLLQTGNHPLLERFLFRAVSGWAHQMAYKKGAYHKQNLIGWAMTKTIEPMCTLIGRFTVQKDYRKLWV